MKRTILIVSPHFPPINAPDHQRVRMALPYVAEFGWDATVLAVRSGCVEGIRDPLLEKALPGETAIVRTSALPVRLTRRFGLGSLALRALPYLLARGNRLLAFRKFDLIFFSTTMFPVMALGRAWLRRFGIPYILDFQDPWVSDYYERPGASKPPGGRFKYGFSQILAKTLEPFSLRRASHVIAVSPSYPGLLRQRYGWLRDDQFTVLPFGAAETDYEFVRQSSVQQRIFDRSDGRQHWVYVGVAGPYMAFALRAIFSALAAAVKQQPDLRQRLRLHFIGTDYAPAER